jgi:hypothetical protein
MRQAVQGRKKTKKTARTVNCPCREASDATYKLLASRDFSVTGLELNSKPSDAPNPDEEASLDQQPLIANLQNSVTLTGHSHKPHTQFSIFRTGFVDSTRSDPCEDQL